MSDLLATGGANPHCNFHNDSLRLLHWLIANLCNEQRRPEGVR